MPSCRVNECSNRSGGGVRLFSIPKRSRDVEIAKRWLKSVWDKELDDEQFALLMKEEFRVCAEHFVESDFDARGKLKADAVPSRFPWNGGQQRSFALSKPKSIPSEHKSNGALVGKLTRALKAAESIVDGEIRDIDRWIVQLETQVEHLRSKREKLVQHKAELGRSLSSSSSTVKTEHGGARGQSSLNDANNFILNSNGTNPYSNFINSTSSNPGESLFLSNDFAAALGVSDLPGDQFSQQQKLKPNKPVRRTADEMMSAADSYSLAAEPSTRLFMPLAPTPPESTEAAVAVNCSASSPHAEQIGYSSAAVTFSSSTNNSPHSHSSNNNSLVNRQFATRRKNLKPTRRIDIVRSAGEDFSDEKNPLPSSSILAASTSTDPKSEPMIEDGGMECEEQEPCSGQQCDLSSFSQTQ